MPSRSKGAVDSAGSPGGWRRGTRECPLPPLALCRVPSRLRGHGARVGADGSVAPSGTQLVPLGTGRFVPTAHRRLGPARAGPTAFPLARGAIGRSQLRIARLGHSDNQRHPGPDRGRTGCARSASATRQLVFTTGTGELGRPRGHQTKGIDWLCLLSLAPRQAPDFAVRQEDNEDPRRRRAGLAAEQVEMGKVGQPAGK